MVDAETIARACAQAAWPNDHAVRNMGMELVSVGPGYATIKMIVTEAMLNSFEICHGGFVFTLADTAFAVACNTYNERAVAQHCQITFLDVARRGDQLLAYAQERVRAKRSGVYDVTVSREGSVSIAEFRGHVVGGEIIRQDKGSVDSGLATCGGAPE
jgi:acyl-CoA thioesterase